jgi:hypothetical protein
VPAKTSKPRRRRATSQSSRLAKRSPPPDSGFFIAVEKNVTWISRGFVAAPSGFGSGHCHAVSFLIRAAEVPRTDCASYSAVFVRYRRATIVRSSIKLRGYYRSGKVAVLAAVVAFSVVWGLSLSPLACNDDAETSRVLPQLRFCPRSRPDSRERGTARLPANPGRVDKTSNRAAANP